MSFTSLDGGSPVHKKSKVEEENSQKVLEFVKKLEDKQARKTKYTQAKIIFPAKAN